MEKVSFSDIESKYSELTQLNNSKKSNVYLVQSILDGRMYIKKELKNYNIEVYRQIKNIESLYMAKVYEIFQCDDTLVVIEEFINGQTLQQIIDNNGPLSEEEAIKYVMNLCSILDILHNQNSPIIHRDIKPSNIIIDNNGILKLIDFDVSRVYKDMKNMDTQILGTKGYASPEQFGFEQTDCRSDIYSVGVLINVLTTGKHIKEELNLGKLRSIIEKCTNISPDNRYSSVKELQLALDKVLAIRENVESEKIVLSLNKEELPLNNKEHITVDLNKEEMPLNNNKEKITVNLQKEDVNVNIDKQNVFNQSYIPNNIPQQPNVNTRVSEPHGYNNRVNEQNRQNNGTYETSRVNSEINNHWDNGAYNRSEDYNVKESSIKNQSSSMCIPGFRTKNPIKMIVATLGYIFLIFGLTMNWSSGNISLIIEDFIFVWLFLALIFFNCNFMNVKDILPITKNRDKSSRKTGVIIYNIVIVFMYGIILEISKVIK